MMPQAPQNNRQAWDHLENYARTLANVGNEHTIEGATGHDLLSAVPTSVQSTIGARTGAGPTK